jgi:hypothetical protein
MKEIIGAWFPAARQGLREPPRIEEFDRIGVPSAANTAVHLFG